MDKKATCTFEDYIRQIKGGNPLKPEAIILCITPLFEEIIELHTLGLGPIMDRTESIIVINETLHLGDYTATKLIDNSKTIQKVITSFEYVSNYPIDLSHPKQKIVGPIVLKGYDSYEKHLEHHDPQTDIYILGLVLASLTFGLDFNLESAVQKFNQNRHNLSALNPYIHPTIAHLILEMTALERHKRPQTLDEVLIRLINYNDYNKDLFIDISKVEGLINLRAQNERTIILEKLKDQLYDLSKRSRLLYYKPFKKYLNLTAFSIPKSFNKPLSDKNKIFTWDKNISSKIEKCQSIYLDNYIEEAQQKEFIQRSKTLINEGKKSINEYGFNPLKLVLNFLHWYKDGQSITSPLMMLSVNIVQEKDHGYILKLNDKEVSINPLLIYYFKTQFGIRLPDYVALKKININAFHNLLQQLIQQKLSGIKLDLHTSLRFKENGNTKSPIHNHQILDENYENLATSYTWILDTHCQVLGNFNYKKISLVKDYDEIMDTHMHHPTFDLLFNANDFKTNKKSHPLPHLNQQFAVFKTDPTQLKAIHTIHDKNTTAGYVIQGPPGTGKSQTIANIITQYAAKGKRVLFVSEKRAATDVVYQKLKTKGLDLIATIIHDAQVDKKAFINDLKSTYHSYLDHSTNLEEIKSKRNTCLLQLDKTKDKLNRYHYKKSRQIPHLGTSLNGLIERSIALKDIKSIDKSLIKNIKYLDWQLHGYSLSSLKYELNKTKYPSRSKHPFFQLDLTYLDNTDGFGSFEEDFINLQAQFYVIDKVLKNYPQLFEQNQDTHEIIKIIYFAYKLINTPQPINLSFLNPKAKTRQRYNVLNSKRQDILSKLAQVISTNIAWQDKIPAPLIDKYIAQAESYEKSFYKLINPKYWSFLKDLQLKYNNTKHIKRQPLLLLKNLKQEYILTNNIDRLEAECQQEFKANFEAINKFISLGQKYKNTPLFQYILSNTNDALPLLKALGDKQSAAIILEKQLKLFKNESSHNWTSLQKSLKSIKSQINNWDNLKDPLSSFPKWPKALQNFFLSQKLSLQSLEKTLLEKAINDTLIDEKNLKDYYQLSASQSLAKIESLENQSKKLNAAYILALHNQKIVDAIQYTQTPHRKLSTEEKKIKDALKKGWRVLKNEFNKKMRFKAIRDLSANEAKPWVQLLKPVWLMSPLSVSDTLPLDDMPFDVVIFDEASQLRLAESIPAIFRGQKTIIVGDSMQLPPTQFFQSKALEDTQDLIDNPNHGIALDTVSLLSQANLKMDAIFLSWHYRSKCETLINFSNAAYYNNQLKTIPSAHVANKRDLQNKGLQLVQLKNTFYKAGSNPGEAHYIARLTKDYFINYPHKSIGVIAFSRQQQRTIEKAIENLCAIDAIYKQLVESNSLQNGPNIKDLFFVKNLENVQGDERDIIIISTGYGYDMQGKFNLNFGPINRKGGTKRLNVIFTRAKEQLLLVTSIQPEDITNTYNKGASHFRSYLQYAYALYEGNPKIAQDILRPLSAEKQTTITSQNKVAQDIAQALEHLGYSTMGPIGYSDLKCDLAILDDTKTRYNLGLILDYKDDNILVDCEDHLILQTQLFKSFGWDIMTVHITDWYFHRDKILQTILKRLENPIGKPPSS